jgi:ribonuclease HI
MTNQLIYTDGACSKNGTPKATGGYAMYLKSSSFGDGIKINRKGETMSIKLGDATEIFYITNIRMEGLAIIATMFLYAEQFVFSRAISDPVSHLNEKFLKQDKHLKLSYAPNELNVCGASAGLSFEIVTDSQFWIDVFHKYLPSQVRKGILLKKKNPDLLLLLHYYTTLFAQNNVQVVLTHVRSHQKGKRTAHADGNDVADVLATSSVGNRTTEFVRN